MGLEDEFGFLLLLGSLSKQAESLKCKITALVPNIDSPFFLMLQKSQVENNNLWAQGNPIRKIQ